MVDVKLNRRGRKVVDYAALGNYSEDSDDDFVNTKKKARVPSPAKPPRLPRVSKLKLPVTAKPLSVNKTIEKENNIFIKLKTPPDAKKPPAEVISPVKESPHNNGTNQMTPNQKNPLCSESVNHNLVTQTPTAKGSKPIDDIDSFYGPEPDLVGHCLLSQDTDIISSCECASSSQESDDLGSSATAAGEASTFMLDPSPAKVTPKKTVVISSDSDSDFAGRPTRKPVRGVVRPKRRKIDDDDSEDDNNFVGVEKKRSKTAEKKPQQEGKVAAKKTRSPEQMTKKNNQKEPVKNVTPVKLKLAKTKEKETEEVDDPEEEEKVYPKVPAQLVETVPIVTPEEVEPPKPKRLKVDEDLKKKVEEKAKKEDDLKMKPPVGRVAAGLFRKVVPKITTPVETPMVIAKPIIAAVAKPVVKQKQPAWNPPGKSNGISTPKIAANSPVIGLRLGISRNNRRCTPLHPDVKIKT